VAVSVVIVTYRTGPGLARCLDSLQGQDELFETILVDNGGGGSEIEAARG
jgi:GT2 family glycosyltransferase